MTADNKPIVQIEKFKKNYGVIEAVKSIDLNIMQGESFAFLGPNGSGKSTIIRSIVGLQFPTEGRILIKDQEINRGEIQTKRLLSFLPQRVSFPDNLTTREIVTIFNKLRGGKEDKIAEIIDFVALADNQDRHIREFSGGMLQRVGLAVTFLDDCEIYILDEPTLNLDPLGIRKFRDFISNLKSEGKTIIFASHLIEDALELADRVGIMVNGDLVKIESVDDFKDEIAREMKVRLKLSSFIPEVEKLLKAEGATLIHKNGQICIFKAEPIRRLAVIKAIEKTGTHIEEIHTDPPNWDSLIYQRFSKEKK
jgi:Cu-processing system ATP-binding protein